MSEKSLEDTIRDWIAKNPKKPRSGPREARGWNEESDRAADAEDGACFRVLVPAALVRKLRPAPHWSAVSATSDKLACWVTRSEAADYALQLGKIKGPQARRIEKRMAAILEEDAPELDADDDGDDE